MIVDATIVPRAVRMISTVVSVATLVIPPEKATPPPASPNGNSMMKLAMAIMM
jgi:hypothetical protein